jgi:trehalose 6-phosphate phosphatase
MPGLSLPERQAGLWAALAACKGRPLFWFFDIDGTLAEIRERPDLVVVPPSRRVLLQRLSHRPQTVVGLASGRPLEDIDRLIPEAAHAGWPVIAAHGALVREGRATRLRLAQDALEAIRRLGEEIRPLVAEYPGSLLELKTGALAWHWRLVDPAQVPALTAALDRLLRDYPSLRRYPAKMAWEVRPFPGPHKGEAIEEIVRGRAGGEWATTACLIVVGDDATDEEAFRWLGRRALCVRIGTQTAETSAQFQLPDPNALEALLALFLAQF